MPITPKRYTLDRYLENIVGRVRRLEVNRPPSGAAGMQIGSFFTASWQAYADSPVTFSCDGTHHSLNVLVASPPAWLDNAGNITGAGLYALGFYVNVSTNPTTAGLIAAGQTLAFGGYIFDLDHIVTAQTMLASSTAKVAQAMDPLALQDSDLPYDTTMEIWVPTDATGQLQCQAFAIRLASAP